jgi:hypothetical protein
MMTYLLVCVVSFGAKEEVLLSTRPMPKTYAK